MAYNNNIQPRGYSMLPEVTKNLLIINGLFYLATYTLSRTSFGGFMDSLALYQPWSADFHWWQVVTSVFMHGSFTHLLVNMFSLWMFGTVIENIWGTKRFLAYYLLTAIGASLLYMVVNYVEITLLTDKLASMGFSEDLLRGIRTAVNPDIANDLMREAGVGSNAIVSYYYSCHATMVGASGAVFGILLAFGMMFPNNIIYLYFLFPIKAKWFVIGIGVFELISGVSGVQTGVAHFAHLGGMLFGFILIRHWKKQGRLYN